MLNVEEMMYFKAHTLSVHFSLMLLTPFPAGPGARQGHEYCDLPNLRAPGPAERLAGR